MPRPRNCPFAWTNSVYRYRNGSVTWRQLGADPFAKPNVQLVGRSARVRIPLRVRMTGPCTFSGTSGTCTGNVTGTGVASIRLDREKLSVVWLVSAVQPSRRRRAWLDGTNQNASDCALHALSSRSDSALHALSSRSDCLAWPGDRAHRARAGLRLHRFRPRRSGYRTTCSATSTAAGCETPRSRADKPVAGAFMSAAGPGRGGRPRHHHHPGRRRPGSDEAKIADLYASFMDTETVEAAGADPAGSAVRRDRGGHRPQRAGRAARPLRPARCRRAGRRGDRVRPGRPQPLCDVRRTGRSRAAGRGVLPAATSTPRSGPSTATTSAVVRPGRRGGPRRLRPRRSSSWRPRSRRPTGTRSRSATCG